MCLILLAWKVHPVYPCVVAANRDEFFARPTAAMRFWEDRPSVLAGRDLRAGGTWMALDTKGRFAALTNFREPEPQLAQAPSRGGLVSAFLYGERGAKDYWRSIDARAYNGFNLVCGDIDGELWHFSNRGAGEGYMLAPGIYGLSNHRLDTPWPKVAQGKSALGKALESLPDDAALFDLLRDESVYDGADLPRTGLDHSWERLLSAAFVRSADYGTCSSTVLVLDRHGRVTADERSFFRGSRETTRNRFRFTLG